jgi:Uma2 family endonuclease
MTAPQLMTPEEMESRAQAPMLLAEHQLLPCDTDDFETAVPEEGYRFELIEGILHVSPSADPYEQDITLAIYNLVRAAKDASGKSIFAHVLVDPRIFVSEAPKKGTVPQPDVAAYLKYPPKPVRSYRGVFPVLVVEVVSPTHREKDYRRNPEIYQRISQILEYWIVDPSKNMARPSMSVFCRQSGDQAFERVDIPAGETYVSQHWPEIKINLARIAID